MDKVATSDLGASTSGLLVVAMLMPAPSDRIPDRFDVANRAALAKALCAIMRTLAVHHVETAGATIETLNERERSTLAMALVEAAWRATAELVGEANVMSAFRAELAVKSE